MTFMSPDYQKPFKINGEIVRVNTDGVGINFKIESQVQKAVLKTLVDMIQIGWNVTRTWLDNLKIWYLYFNWFDNDGNIGKVSKNLNS